MLADKIKTVASRGGGRLNVSAIYDAAKRENEIIADVSSISPMVLQFEGTTDGRADLYMLRDIQKGVYKNPKQYYEHRRKTNSGWYPFIPFGLSAEEVDQKMKEYLVDLAKKATNMKKFLK